MVALKEIQHDISHTVLVACDRHPLTNIESTLHPTIQKYCAN